MIIYKQAKAPTVEELIQSARGQLNAAFIDSTRHLEWWRQKPNKYYMMQEIYYHGTLPPELIQDYKERLQIVFDHFLRSETFQQITAQKGSLRIGEPEQFRSMKINDIQVFVVMDFHYYDELRVNGLLLTGRRVGNLMMIVSN